MASPFLMDEQSAVRRGNENVQCRMIFICENNFACTTFVFVQNGKFHAKNSKFAGGIQKQTAKCIITSSRRGKLIRGKKESTLSLMMAEAHTVRAIKAPQMRTRKRKGVMPVAHQKERKL